MLSVHKPTKKELDQYIYIPISKRKGNFQGAPAIHTYMPLNYCEGRIESRNKVVTDPR